MFFLFFFGDFDLDLNLNLILPVISLFRLTLGENLLLDGDFYLHIGGFGE